MEETLRGKVALIAGGAGGIGAATAKLMAARGALVIVNYLKNQAAARRVVEEIHANGQLAVAVQADVRESEHVKTMVECILEESEQLDIMVDSVSSSAFVKPFAEMTWDEFICFALQGSDRTSLIVVVNYGPHQSQCYLQIPFDEIKGAAMRLRDLMGPAVYEREGDQIHSQGLYLDLPAWGHHVFELTTVAAP